MASETNPTEAAAAPESPEAIAPAVISNEEAAALLENGELGGVRVFDITAQKVNRTRLPNLEQIAKNFALHAGAALCGLLGRDASMKFDSLERGKTVDLLAALPNPATIVVVRLKPLPEQALLNFEPAMLLALLDGFFGGTGRSSSDPLAAASSAAQRFLGVLVRNLAADFAAAWAPISPVEIEMLKQESNPRYIQMGAAQDGVIVVKFVIEFGDSHGMFEWLLPESQIAPIRDALMADGAIKNAKPQKSWTPALSAILQSAQIETRAVLGEAQISLRELVQLAPGDVIPIEAPEQVTLLAQDVPLYRGRFGISQGHNALKILNGIES